MRVRVTYETVTGDDIDNGWQDEVEISEELINNQILWDECNREDAIVTLAVETIGTNVEPSSSHFHKGVWYTDADPIHDRAFFEEGKETRHSYHLQGFSLTAERRIFEKLK